MGVLDDMTKGITERKQAVAGPKLTPVGLEGNVKPSLVGIPDAPGGVFLANELVADMAKDLRRQAAALIAVADGLDLQTGQSSLPAFNPVVEAAVEKKAAEVEGDAKAKARKAAPATTAEFIDHLATISAEAQAQVFTAADATPKSPTTAGGWTCPDHGADTLKQLTSRKGRVYTACECGQFEKE